MLQENESHSYYSAPGIMTDPGEYVALLQNLPAETGALCEIVQGLLIHPLNTGLYDVELTSVQKKEVNIRPVKEMLRMIHHLDDRPITTPRPVNERLVGNCRDFSVLLCSFLRYQGTPARVRVGFATYFGSEMNYDHWIVEVWDRKRKRWHLVDPQLDAIQRKNFNVTFDTLNLSKKEFISAGLAWQLIREGKAKSGMFGHNRRLRGIGYIRSSLVKELAALNKVEVLPWDDWWELASKAEDSVSSEERDLLDRISTYTQDIDTRFQELRSAFEEDDRFSFPVKSRLKVLGLSEGFVHQSQITFLPSDSDLLTQKSMKGPSISEQQEVDYLDRQVDHLLSIPLDPNNIVVRGAQQNNLRHIDVKIPRNKMVVITGVSGSGKSSLAFDTLYAEGQRRYVESLSSYVRRFLEQMDKPRVDYIGGLSPAIAIEQKTVSRNPRSTVATVTELMDYLRVLFSTAGIQHCPQCGRAVKPSSVQTITEQLASLPPGTRYQILAPILRSRKGNVSSLISEAIKNGYHRARIDGETYDLGIDTIPRFNKTQPHSIELIIDRLVAPASLEEEFVSRLADSVETGLLAGKGLVLIQLQELAGDLMDGETVQTRSHEFLLHQTSACPHCELSLPKLTATLFSFNAPTGMCPDCNGLGTKLEVDASLIITNPELSLLDGASRWHGEIRKKKNAWHIRNIQTLADHYGVDVELPWKDLPKKFQDVILYGSGDEKIHFTFENQSGTWRGEHIEATKGVIYHINRLFRQTQSEYTRRWYMSFMSNQPCPSCGGTRLCAEARTVMVGGKTFPDVLKMTIQQAYRWVRGLSAGGEEYVLNHEQLQVVSEVIKELESRLLFILNVGLHYLTLDRPAPTLSGGEGQRIRLASQLGCGLVGVMYILDEPSIGLHARDQRALIETLLRLRDMGNTILVVEHDAETMRLADWIIDLGPGAGALGGEVVAAGTPEQIMADPDSLTGRYLSGEMCVVAPNGWNGTQAPERRRPLDWLTITGARLFNLKSVEASFPLGVLTCITGVSGSGKSSLVAETLFPALQRHLHNAQVTPGPYDRIEGLEFVDKVIDITQDPIGRTPRSNPATYVGFFDDIRQVFAATTQARQRGYKSGRFSFNVKGGRCEACAGHGQKKIEMHFLPDVWVTCQECKGARFNRHTLEIRYKGKSIAEVLDMDVREALEFFSAFPKIQRSLQTLFDVGLEYIKLGQSATTLSGGEAQRVKLAKELSRVSTGRTVYILDEPTTGLHFADIQRLLDVLHRLTDQGNTVIVIEHNLDVIKTADWIIDLGPEGGAEGGYIVAQGTPEEVIANRVSYTGKALIPVLEFERSRQIVQV